MGFAAGPAGELYVRLIGPALVGNLELVEKSKGSCAKSDAPLAAPPQKLAEKAGWLVTESQLAVLSSLIYVTGMPI